MANEEVLGPRKTMFVLVIVVGCFAVLWPRILAPLILGHTRDQLKPNEFDREAGCCEVMFETELAVLELINEVCSSAVHVNGKLSPYAATQCRKAVNDTCGMDIAVFLKRTENVGKTSKILIETMKDSNSTCLKEHFGVAPWSYGPHLAVNSWKIQDTVKQERPLIRSGQHPALRERGRAIPPGTAAPSRTVAMPPHVRVRSPLSVYYELDIKPPPIPGMRPPLGSPGGPVPAPKSSMGFVMPIYTICIIIFFVYTLSKLLFKRTASPYEAVSTDPQFRRRVFREDSRTTPDKLGPKERDAIVTAISGLVAEVQQQMEASYGHNQQRQDTQDNTRQYTNGTILHNSGPVHIVASEYREASKEKSPELRKDYSRQTKEILSEQDELDHEIENTHDPIETLNNKKESSVTVEETKPEVNEINVPSTTFKELILETQQSDSGTNKISVETENTTLEIEKAKPEQIGTHSESYHEEETDTSQLSPSNRTEIIAETKENEDVLEKYEVNHTEDNLIKLAESSEDESDVAKLTEYFIEEETRRITNDNQGNSKTHEILEDALREASPEYAGEDEQENASVKVMGMEVTAHSADGGAWVRPEAPLPPPHQPQQQRPHEAEEVKSIFLETEIPQKSRVLVTDFAENRPDDPKPANSSPMVVSGKMTLSLIQDASRETPERDPESTVDDFTTASAVTQPAVDKEADEEFDEEIEEEIEIEEIEEEVEDEEEEEVEPAKGERKPETKGTH